VPGYSGPRPCRRNGASQPPDRIQDHGAERQWLTSRAAFPSPQARPLGARHHRCRGPLWIVCYASIISLVCLLTGLEWRLTFSGGGCWVETLDFRVEISGGVARGYEVVLRAPDGVEVSAAKQLPVSAVELDALAARIPDAVIASSATVRYSPSREERPVQQLGGLLFDDPHAAVGGGRDPVPLVLAGAQALPGPEHRERTRRMEPRRDLGSLLVRPCRMSVRWSLFESLSSIRYGFDSEVSGGHGGDSSKGAGQDGNELSTLGAA
jgi:hypothetical protein